MGKGTALKDKSDLDCVLILNEIEGVEDLKSKINRIKKQLTDILQAKDWSDWKIEVGRSTRFCVKFDMSKPNKIVHVDLLPTFAKEKIGKSYPIDNAGYFWVMQRLYSTRQFQN
jgi:hypothetical protein